MQQSLMCAISLKKADYIDCNLIACSVDSTLIYSQKTVVTKYSRYWHVFPLKLVITDNGYSEI